MQIPKSFHNVRTKILKFCRDPEDNQNVDLKKVITLVEAVIYMPYIISKNKNISHDMSQVMNDLTPFSKNFKEKFILVGKSKLSYHDQLKLDNGLTEINKQPSMDDIRKLEVVSFTIQNKFSSLQEAFKFFDISHSQRISIKDFNTGLFRMHLQMPIPDIIHVFAYADKNMRGQLDMEDFKTIFYF